MKYLLDTHALLWFLSDDPRLSDRAREIVADGSQDVSCCDVVAWEIAIKASLGRLEVPTPLDGWYRNQLFGADIGSSTISLAAISLIRTLPWHHRDPFDRLLAATALTQGLTLVSRDVIFDAYGVPRVW